MGKLTCLLCMARQLLKKIKKKVNFFNFSRIFQEVKKKISPPEICQKNEKKITFFLFFFVQKTTVNSVIKKVRSFFSTLFKMFQNLTILILAGNRKTNFQMNVLFFLCMFKGFLMKWKHMVSFNFDRKNSFTKVLFFVYSSPPPRCDTLRHTNLNKL